MNRNIFKRLLLWLAILTFTAWTVFPLIWMVLSSLKTRVTAFQLPPPIFFTPTFQNFTDLFSDRANILGFLSNSLIASVGTTAIALVLGTMGGYALARGHFRFKDDLSFWIISTRMAPIAAVIVPLYMIFRHLELLNTIPGLILAYITFTLPFAIWILKGFFEGLPVSLEEAARIDGCTPFSAFFYVALPLVKPGLFATAVLSFIFCWNDYLFAAVLTNAGTQTVPVAVSLLISQTGIVWGQVMATGTVILIPAAIAGLAVRRYLVHGLSMGAVSGE